MKANSHSARSWTTASFGGNTDTSPVELLSLGAHLGTCTSPYKNLFALHCMAEATREFMAARFMTTLTALGLLVAVVALML